MDANLSCDACFFVIYMDDGWYMLYECRGGTCLFNPFHLLVGLLFASNLTFSQTFWELYGIMGS